MMQNLVRHFAFLPNSVVIVAAKRTPIGSHMGGLSSIPAPHLQGLTIKACLSQAGLKPDQITEAIIGHVISAGVGQSPARQAAISAGLPVSTICTGVNKVCSSGMKSITFAAQGIALGHSDVVIAGGMENMSQAPHVVSSLRAGLALGDSSLADTIFLDGLKCPFNKTMMGNCAEQTVIKYQITREEQDNFCVDSYKRSADAWARGFFKDEVISVEVQSKKGATTISEDEEYKKVKFDKISTLKPVFEKTGTITAANASSINDGSSSMILMSESRARDLGVRPLARILSFADAETEPVHFGVAPAEAMNHAVQRAGLNVQSVDLWEINEAFSSVVLANMKILGLNHGQVNVNGGGVSLGHPVGMSGNRIVGSLIYALKEKNKRIGVAGICNGGGGATAIVIEAL
jgi:acetyl-CoA C-acetyltransferase